MKDPIEGEFTVIGEKPPREPIIKSWSGLFTFIAVTLIAIGIRYCQIVSEYGLWDSPGDASGRIVQQADEKQKARPD